MRRMWKIKFVLIALAVVVASGAVVMWLWNWLVPELFHGPYITFLHAIGLLLLCRLLFRGFHPLNGNRTGRRWRAMRKMKEKMDKMTPEERERVRDLWKMRCSKFGNNCDSSKDNAGEE